MTHRAFTSYAAATAGGGAGEALIRKHAALVDRAARRIAARTGGAVAAEDLWSAGAMGLLEAARRFDGAQDVKFETFAEHRVRGAMLDELRRMDHLPRRLRQEAEKLEAARSRVSQQLGREAGAEDLASALGLTLEEVDGLASLAQPHLPVLEDSLASASPSAETHAADAQGRRALVAALAELPERLQLVMSLHYEEDLTYREIARVLGVSEPRVCQLHREAVKLLREAVEGGEG
jgi:RNA polymerase sigma factor for flagellar operon FliA